MAKIGFFGPKTDISGPRKKHTLFGSNHVLATTGKKLCKQKRTFFPNRYQTLSKFWVIFWEEPESHTTNKGVCIFKGTKVLFLLICLVCFGKTSKHLWKCRLHWKDATLESFFVYRPNITDSKRFLFSFCHKQFRIKH